MEPLKIQNLPDHLTPDRLPQSLFEQPYFFLLESSLTNHSNVRYTIAGLDPVRVLTCEENDDFFGRFRHEIQSHPQVTDTSLPFTGGWIGFLGYEMNSLIEKKIAVRTPDLLPQALFGLYDSFYLYDHQKQKPFFVSLPYFRNQKEPELLRRLLEPAPASFDLADTPELPASAIQYHLSQKDYLEKIDQIKKYIHAGDCYQVNFSQRLSCPIAEPSSLIYQRLRRLSPSPYAAYLNLGKSQILSSSPECFLTLQGRDIITRPIKGTRPRGHTPTEDSQLQKELTTSAKDRAELLMITDLERNDLGRVCSPGSVSVPEVRTIESFPQVHHLVSTIKGKLAPDKDIIDLLQATFPGGSITGAPKVRAMEIIRQLEPHPRNVYCGSIGYVSLNGSVGFNIAIRTMVIKESQATLWSGGGIVADSDPELEYQESLTKAQGMLMSLGFRQEFFRIS